MHLIKTNYSVFFYFQVKQMFLSINWIQGEK